MNRFAIGLVSAFFACFALAGAVGAKGSSETVLHTFCSPDNCPDGAIPSSGLIDVNGTFYGTTGRGGTDCEADQECGGGTVFALNTYGKQTVLYSFCLQAKCADGRSPTGGLIDVNGILYGVTSAGGIYCDGCGTVFAFDLATGLEKVLYAFCKEKKCTDGVDPAAGLTEVNGTLYGTTEGGGAYCDDLGCGGTVFSIDPATGKHTVLHSFQVDDGDAPESNLVFVGGKLFGTTLEGGGGPCSFNGMNGCGTVFSLDLKTGVLKTVYSFCQLANCADGTFPGNLLTANGKLYGTAFGGGVETCPYWGCGTAFSLDPKTGDYSLLYSFCSKKHCADGQGPIAALIDVKGTLYGTTFNGGANCEKGGGGGCGTVFALDPATDAEKVLYSFCAQESCADGSSPSSVLLNVDGMLYGTAQNGGNETYCAGFGCGTAFTIKP
jgi:uncharacterized repeat protein (TIGR03803 family)